MVGGLEAVQISTILLALPMIPVLVILALSFLKRAKEDFGKALAAPVYSVPRLSIGNTVIQQ